MKNWFIMALIGAVTIISIVFMMLFIKKEVTLKLSPYEFYFNKKESKEIRITP